MSDETTSPDDSGRAGDAMSFQVGRELLKNYLNNYVAFVALLKKQNMSNEMEIMRTLNHSLNTIKDMDLPDFPENAYMNNSNGGGGGTEYINSLPAVKAFFYCMYIFIFLVAVCGNALVCYVVIRNKTMHTVTNFFITNLAFSDILLCTFAVPFTPLYLLTFRSWVFGKLLCHLLPYAQGVSVYISAFTLMSIAIDRFFVIIYPFKPRMEIKICLIIIACIWTSAAVLTFPYGWYMELIPNGDLMYCEEFWPHEESRKAFGFSTSVLQFVIPFIIISFCYMKVCCRLSDRARAKPGAKSARKEELERERTRRTNRMLISMVVIFGISWLPLNINNLVQDFYLPASQWKYARAFFLLAHAAAMSSTCYNPFLYAWLNENFRKEFKQVLPCFRSSPSPQTASQRNARRSDAHAIGDRTCNGHEVIQLQEQSLAVGPEGDGEPGDATLPKNNSVHEMILPIEEESGKADAATMTIKTASKSTAVSYSTVTDTVKMELAKKKNVADAAV